MIIKVGGLEPLGPIGVYAYDIDETSTTEDGKLFHAQTTVWLKNPCRS